MKTLTFMLLLVPIFPFGQKKMSYRQRAILEHKQEVAERRAAKIFKPGLDEAGYYLQRASNFYNISIISTIVGGGIAIGMANSDNSDAGYALGGLFGLAGFITHIIGNNEIRKAGNSLRKSKFAFQGNKISFTF